MKTIVVAIALLLSAPAWAQDHSPAKDSEVKRMWPGGAYIEPRSNTLEYRPPHPDAEMEIRGPYRVPHYYLINEYLPCTETGTTSVVRSLGTWIPNARERELVEEIMPDGGVSQYYRWKNPTSYETKIVPESELEKWLNEGWECEKVYTIQKATDHNVIYFGDQGFSGGFRPVNKAIIRRAKP